MVNFISIFKPINSDKGIIFIIIAFVFKDPFYNCITFIIVFYLYCHEVTNSSFIKTLSDTEHGQKILKNYFSNLLSFNNTTYKMFLNNAINITDEQQALDFIKQQEIFGTNE